MLFYMQERGRIFAIYMFRRYWVSNTHKIIAWTIVGKNIIQINLYKITQN